MENIALVVAKFVTRMVVFYYLSSIYRFLLPEFVLVLVTYEEQNMLAGATTFFRNIIWRTANGFIEN